jgi:hypothetical protein
MFSGLEIELESFSAAFCEYWIWKEKKIKPSLALIFTLGAFFERKKKMIYFL